MKIENLKDLDILIEQYKCYDLFIEKLPNIWENRNNYKSDLIITFLKPYTNSGGSVSAGCSNNNAIKLQSLIKLWNNGLLYNGNPVLGYLNNRTNRKILTYFDLNDKLVKRVNIWGKKDIINNNLLLELSQYSYNSEELTTLEKVKSL